MWPDSFDPASLTRDASLNKLVIRHAPGAKVAHVGKAGGDLLGGDAVVALVRDRCGADVAQETVGDWLAACVTDDQAGVVDEIGSRLASLIATLRDPDTATEARGARRTYLEVWPTFDLVLLGGGLMRGGVGERVAWRAASALARDGVEAPVLRMASHPEWLGLVGAARSALPGARSVAVLDCGQTAIKRGVALIGDQQLIGLRVLPPVRVAGVAASEMSTVVTGTVRALIERAGGELGEAILSIAAYLRDGLPIRDHASIYELLDPSSIESGAGIAVRLLHDGTAAWRGTGATTPSAVISLGTWLGVGIGPQPGALRTLAPEFSIEAW